MRGHVRQRAPGKWSVVLDVGRDDSGKRKQKWKSGYRTKREAEDALVDLLGKRKRGETIDPDMTPFGDYLVAWIDGRADELAPLSVTQYRSVVRNHVSKTPLGGCRSVESGRRMYALTSRSYSGRDSRRRPGTSFARCSRGRLPTRWKTI